jgi:hypothetical protein
MEWYNAGNLIYRAKRHLIGLDIAELFCSAPARPSYPSSQFHHSNRFTIGNWKMKDYMKRTGFKEGMQSLKVLHKIRTRLQVCALKRNCSKFRHNFFSGVL